jgi:hypothetical protein
MIKAFWRGLSFESKAALATMALPLVLLAGFLAATGVTSVSSASDLDPDVFVETLTVDRVVTRTSDGQRTVVRTVRVVPKRAGSRNVLATAVELRVVTAPGRRDLVTIPQVRTVVETRGGETRTRVVTDKQVVTDRRVVTNQRVVTSERVVTHDRTVTDVRTEQVTVPVTTVRTVTDTVPVTETVIRTETLTPPPVTVTVTCPPNGCG